MPVENLEDQGLEKNPDLELALFKFWLTLPEYRNDKTVHAKITEAIKKDGKVNYLFGLMCLISNICWLFLCDPRITHHLWIN